VIRHIVLWKLIAEDEAGKAADAATISAALTALVGEIDGLQSLSVVRDEVGGANHDLALVAEYDSLEALAAYQVHPAHVRVATEVTKPRTTERACVDFEV